MPHSSGGGSHSGGSHSGGSSSHSSRSSGGGSSGGSFSNRRTSGQPFAGAKRYLYYRDHQPYFIYANYDIRKSSKGNLVMGIIVFTFFLLPFMIGALIGMAQAFKKPDRIDYFDGRKPEIVIEDNLGIFESKRDLKDTLKDFYEETGIVPAVITVRNEDWNEDYKSLEAYAYDVYVNRFHDEYHWLIIYSESTKDNDFNDWYWEGMQGNYTDPILTEKITGQFTESLQTRLLQRDTYSVDEAIGATFVEYTPKMMKMHFDGLLFGVCMFFFLLMGGASFYTIFVAYKPEKVPEYYKNAQPCELNVVFQESCSFCGGVFIVGMHTSCPHCGAVIPPHNYVQDAQGNIIQITK